MKADEFALWLAVQTPFARWTHCGDRHPHFPHEHDATFVEGTYRGVPCMGTPGNLKVKRRMKVLLLIEVAAREGVDTGEREDMGGPVLQDDTGAETWTTTHVTSEIVERLLADFPAASTDRFWYVRGAKLAVAP